MPEPLKGLRHYRKCLSLTQSAVAERLGVTANTIARWERGERNMPAWVFRRIDMERKFSAEINRLRLSAVEDATVGPSRADVVYRRLARKYHPDHNPGCTEIMKDLNELYQAMKKRSVL